MAEVQPPQNPTNQPENDDLSETQGFQDTLDLQNVVNPLQNTKILQESFRSSQNQSPRLNDFSPKNQTPDKIYS